MIFASVSTHGVASVSTHGVTGTWLDEIVELGVPLVLFIGLWWWSTRKEKRKAKSAPKAEPKK
jgi:hypothetical protein